MKNPENATVEAHSLAPHDDIPNSRLPLMLYRGALQGVCEKLSPEDVRELFARHQWTDGWVNGVYPYHHYHSTAHEVLGCFRGSARVLFGGEGGLTVDFTAGDVVVIPAGVAHKNLGDSPDFQVVGAYPSGQKNDLCYGRAEERPQAELAIAAVPLPSQDPVYGGEGPLRERWTA
jgi:uncharacterized protein YjlB